MYCLCIIEVQFEILARQARLSRIVILGLVGAHAGPRSHTVFFPESERTGPLEADGPPTIERIISRYGTHFRNQICGGWPGIA